MIIVDSALEKRAREGNPIRVALVGAGFIAKGVANQIQRSLGGMEVAAVSNRTIEKAEAVFAAAGSPDVRRVSSVGELEEAVRARRPVVTDDAELLCRAGGIDAVVDLTGEIDFGARVVLEAIRHGKHVVSNVEMDATIGPILKAHADRAGVVYTNCDGDQPGVIMNLLRWVRCIGFRPVLAGNIKGMLDHYRTPETQARFAAVNRQTPRMATNFADGTKLAMEMAVVANATGFRVGRRGMYGPACRHVDESPGLFPAERMLDGGLVDYILGAEPSPGVFVIGYNDGDMSRFYANYFKRGEGPFHVFYVPYHFPHAELPLTVARAVLFGDAAIAPLGAPACEVITVAKRDLKPGDALDGFGGFASYGLLENREEARAQNLLPMGLSEGCRLLRPVARDAAISREDVAFPPERLCDALRREQDEHFAGARCPVGRWDGIPGSAVAAGV
jgi:predicted homoserine dehydrogenase-like protein